MSKKYATIFGEALVVGGTVHRKDVARINGEKVGVENYAIWKAAMEKAMKAFYDYEVEVEKVAKGKDNNVKEVRDIAMDCLKAIFDIVGEINGHKLVRDNDIFVTFAKYAVAEKTELIGEALLLDSKLKNVKKELKNVNDGVNSEWLEAKEAELAELEESLKIAKKNVGSGKPVTTRVSYNSFAANFERKLAKLVSDQSMKTWAELEEEAEKRRIARREKTKAKRNANKK